MELHVCASCRRHVAELACPFCGHEGDELGARGSTTPLGRLSRAAVFGAAATLAACGGPPKPTQPQQETARPQDNTQQPEDAQQRRTERRPPDPQDLPHRRGGGCSVADPATIEQLQKRVAEAKTDVERAQAQNDLERAMTPMCAPYGAPPARRRTV